MPQMHLPSVDVASKSRASEFQNPTAAPRKGSIGTATSSTSKGGIQMHPYLKNTLLTAATAALFIPASAMAQKSIGGATGEARLHPGTWNQRLSRSRSGSMYRNSAPVIVRSERAPAAVAQTPTERRSFSYEPSQAVDAPETARRADGTVRSYSYEPAAPSYSAPRMRSHSSRPSFLLQKTDPGKYRGF